MPGSRTEPPHHVLALPDGGLHYTQAGAGAPILLIHGSLCDYRYREYGFNGFAITPGHWHLDGEAALAYARIRKSSEIHFFIHTDRCKTCLVYLH